MRRYAAEYLSGLAKGIKELEPAAKHYHEVHECMKTALRLRNQNNFPEKSVIEQIQRQLLMAGEAEKQGIAAIEEYLDMEI